MDKNVTPVLIFAPGLGRYDANTGDGVADALAVSIGRLTHGHCSTTTDATVTAPTGLRVAKTITNASGEAILQVFELDYLGKLDPEPQLAGPRVVPGLFRSGAYAVVGCLKLVAALRRPAKTWMTKAQLFLGFLLVALLGFAALVALYAALVAMDVDLPWPGVFGEQAAPWTFGIASLGVVATWSRIRKKALALAGTTQNLIRFVTNEDSTADTVALQVDNAVDGLRDNGWTGAIHLAGYSFGSLVLIESLFPRITSRRSNERIATVASLTTIGCPIDMVRLYQPDFTKDREERRPELPWKNVFNAADIFGSNLLNGDDKNPGTSNVLDFVTKQPESAQYGSDKLGLLQIFTSGKLHASYWGAPDRANCFDPLIPGWLGQAEADPEPAPAE